jgi:hypothetical protein
VNFRFPRRGNVFAHQTNKLTDWKIKLTPRDSEVLSEISSILITGQLGSINADYINKIKNKKCRTVRTILESNCKIVKTER